jgi:hypothetical protein
MRKVSASPFGLRNVFPILWFGGNIFLGIQIFGDPRFSNDAGFLFIASAIIGCVVSRVLALRLVDEVYDEGDSLLVRRNKNEQRIYLHQIRKLRSNRAWITLKTTCAGEIGKNISFVPTARLFHFTKHPYFVELKQRVQSANNT